MYIADNAGHPATSYALVCYLPSLSCWLACLHCNLSSLGFTPLFIHFHSLSVFSALSLSLQHLQSCLISSSLGYPCLCPWIQTLTLLSHITYAIKYVTGATNAVCQSQSSLCSKQSSHYFPEFSFWLPKHHPKVIPDSSSILTSKFIQATGPTNLIP